MTKLNNYSLYLCHLFLSLLTINTSVLHAKSPKAWKFLSEKEGIKLFSQKSSDEMIPFKAVYIMDVELAKIHSIISNYKEKHLWAPKLKAVKIHKLLARDHYIFSEFYATPWPAYDRQFLLEGKIYKQADMVIFQAKSVDDKKLIDPSHVLATIEEITLTLKRISIKQTQIEFVFRGDMNGWLPNWLKRLIQKKWPYKFIKNLEFKIKDFEKYENKKGI